MATSRKTNRWVWIFISLLLVIIAILLAIIYGGARQNNSQVGNDRLKNCQDAAHQQYDPQIAVAMSNGTSRQLVMMEQQALGICQQDYGN